MTQIAQGAHVYLFPEPGQVYRVQADDVATVQVLYGAPSAVITLTAQSQTFGPYDSPAKLKVTANTAPAEYTLIRAHYAELTQAQIDGGAVGALASNNAGGVIEPDGDVPTLGGSVTLTAMQTAFDAGTAPGKAAFQDSVSGDKIPLGQKGAANGVAPLGGDLLVPLANATDLSQQTDAQRRSFLLTKRASKILNRGDAFAFDATLSVRIAPSGNASLQFLVGSSGSAAVISRLSGTTEAYYYIAALAYTSGSWTYFQSSLDIPAAGNLQECRIRFPDGVCYLVSVMVGPGYSTSMLVVERQA